LNIVFFIVISIVGIVGGVDLFSIEGIVIVIIVSIVCIIGSINYNNIGGTMSMLSSLYLLPTMTSTSTSAVHTKVLAANKQRKRK